MIVITKSWGVKGFLRYKKKRPESIHVCELRKTCFMGASL